MLPLVLSIQVMITLSETDTIWLIDIPATCVAEGSEEMEKVKAVNEKYEVVSVPRAVAAGLPPPPALLTCSYKPLVCGSIALSYLFPRLLFLFI